ncbi:MAG: metallopeptidase TldD-related protein [Desulfitobacterium hafniense]|nr:metallopeptidase TldD-related protein [Desulfitobacterium hafniense]
MRLIAQLEDILNRVQASPPKEELKLKAWRVLIHESKAISLGLKDNIPGGVYTPPSYRQGESGEVFLVWADDLCSQARVQLPPQATQTFWLEKLEEWRQAAYNDPDAICIPTPEPLPVVALEDRKIQKILAGDDKILFNQLERMLDEKPEGAKVQGSVQAAWGYRHVRNSNGLAVTHQESQYAISYSFDSLVGTGFAKRRLIEENEWDFLWQRTVGYYEALKTSASDIRDNTLRDNTLVVLAPSVVDEMLGQFIVPNFWGQSILEGQSAYTQDKFSSNQKVFAEGSSLYIDPLRPFEWGSYMLTQEGIPAQHTVLVNNGELITPILRVKDARRWGGKPTAIPQGTSGLYLVNKDETEWDSLLKEVEDAVLVLSVLGLHTQNSVTGNYSMSAPQSLRVENGRITGKIDVKISGNFFRDLASDTTRYAKTKVASKPYLVLKTTVQKL